MPLVDALRISLCSLPVGTPGAISPGAEMFAGVLTAWLGTVLPSGSVGFAVSAAVALVTATLAVQAPGSRASATSALALCHALMRRDLMMTLPRRPARPHQGRVAPPASSPTDGQAIGYALVTRKLPSAAVSVITALPALHGVSPGTDHRMPRAGRGPRTTRARVPWPGRGQWRP